MLHDILVLLIGAALVTAGVLAAALADRIRGVKLERRITAPARAFAKVHPLPMQGADTEIVEPLPAPKTRAQPIEVVTDDREQRVIGVLITSGFKKAVATSLARACRADERTTVEAWVRAALFRGRQNASVS